MTTLSSRSGENESHPIRNERFFQMEHHWYYTTREGVNVGPFDSYHEADQGVAEFIEFVSAADDKILEAFKQSGRLVS